jgi:hypothetical protein
MRRLLESRRRRKRVALVLGVAFLGGVAALLGLHLSNTAHPQKETFEPGKAQVIEEQAPKKLSEAERRAVFAALDRFVQTALERHDLAAAYDLTTPEFRGGETRAQWVKGNNPIYPYPVSAHSAHIKVSYPRDVMVQLLLKARRGSRLDPLLVDVELKEVGKSARRRWLVDYYLPSEALQTPSDHPRSGPAIKDPGLGPGHLTMMWLLVPAGIFLLIVLVPVALALREWFEGRKAERKYADSRKLPPLPPGSGRGD